MNSLNATTKDQKQLLKKRWEREKIIYFGQVLGVIQIILTVVSCLFFGFVVYLYNNFRISDLFQSAVILNFVVVLAIGFVSLTVIFLIMWIKTLISCIFAIKKTSDKKNKLIFIRIILLPAFFTFYYRNSFKNHYVKSKKPLNIKIEKETIVNDLDIEHMEQKVSN